MKKFDHWEIAFRKIGEEKYRIISNPKWAWAADPFLVKHNNKLYLFAELFLYKSERNGIIGYCEFDGESFGEWKVSMDRHWHLSYPNVWTSNGKLYMCPESYQADEIAIYELKEFPDCWEKVKVILQNGKYVDSTFFNYDNHEYMFTFQLSNDRKGGNLLLCKLDDSWNVIEKEIVCSDISKGRPGGKIMVNAKGLIRVSQNCEKSYGSGLVFNKIISLDNKYEETEVRRVFPQDINVLSKKKYIGIHTYNNCDGIEVIDLKYESFSLRELCASKRVRKVFLNKY